MSDPWPGTNTGHGSPWHFLRLHIWWVYCHLHYLFSKFHGLWHTLQGLLTGWKPWPKRWMRMLDFWIMPVRTNNGKNGRVVFGHFLTKGGGVVRSVLRSVLFYTTFHLTSYMNENKIEIKNYIHTENLYTDVEPLKWKLKRDINGFCLCYFAIVWFYMNVANGDGDGIKHFERSRNVQIFGRLAARSQILLWV